MIPVNIGLQDIADEFYLTPDEMDSFAQYVVQEVASKFARYWEKQAKENLHSTRNEFIRSIYIEKVDNKNIIVGLKGAGSNGVEQGFEAFDMKPWFEKSNKTVHKLALDDKGKVKRDKYGKTSSGGWYLTIPFRWSTPDALGESSVFSNSMPEEIHQIVKSKNKAGDDSGLKKSEIPEQYQIPKTRERIVLQSKIYEEYTHKSSLYEGMVKSNMEFHSQYNTFRRVSDLSDPNAWIHPGVEAKNLADKALEEMNIELTVDKAIDQFLQQI